MPTSNWSRGLFGPTNQNTGDQSAGDQNMRVSDAERQAVADRLAVHYGDGRLDQEEFDERVGRAMSAKTRADLAGLLDDLPEAAPSAADAGAAGAPGIQARPADGTTATARRHRHGHPVIALAIIAIIVLSFGHAIAWFVAPWLWVGIIVLIVLAATGHLGHHHHH
jgi:hypothetical protein